MHVVVLKGTGVSNQGNSSLADIQGTITATLQGNGIGVIGVGASWATWTDRTVNLSIEINAQDQDSAEYVRQLVTNNLTQLIWNTPVSSFPYLLNVAMRVESDDANANAGSSATNASVNPNQAPSPSLTDIILGTGGAANPIVSTSSNIMMYLIIGVIGVFAITSMNTK